jgi:hypothetical protein
MKDNHQQNITVDVENMKREHLNLLPDNIIINALKNDADLLFKVDKNRRTHEMYMTALETCGTAIQYFQNEMLTPEIANKAVEKTGWALVYIPDKLKTPELCRKALNNNLQSDFDHEEIIRYVPFPSVCLEYLKNHQKNDCDPFVLFEYMKKDIITPEIANLAFKLDSYCFELVPDRLKTPEMCIEAVENNCFALKHVPYVLKTPEMCRIALNNALTMMSFPYGFDHKLIAFVPFPDVCMEHLKKDKVLPLSVFENIQKDIITPEMAKLAVSRNLDCFSIVPDRLKTPEMCADAVEKRWDNIKFIPEHMKTKQMCEIAMKGDKQAQYCVTDDFKINMKPPEKKEQKPIKRKGLKF